MITTLEDLKKTLEDVQSTLDKVDMYEISKSATAKLAELDALDMWLAQTKIDLKHTIECTDELLEGVEK